jgi:hypothetical protein
MMSITNRTETTVTAEEVRMLLRDACDSAGGQAAWCKIHGISTAFVNDVLQDRREPSGLVLFALGLEKTVNYREKRHG